jgi:hypothetical protein
LKQRFGRGGTHAKKRAHGGGAKGQVSGGKGSTDSII